MFLKDLSRALRRHHVARLKKNRAGYAGGFLTEPRHLGALVQHPCCCSCWMCGNPRKWWGERSIQERRWMQQECD